MQFFSAVKEGTSTRDLRSLFAAHFDPTIAGSKLEKSSYEKICAELGQNAAGMTFLTDNVKGTFDTFLDSCHLSTSSYWLRVSSTPVQSTVNYETTHPTAPLRATMPCATALSINMAKTTHPIVMRLLSSIIGTKRLDSRTNTYCTSVRLPSSRTHFN